MATTITGMKPLFQVYDVRTSIAFYTDKLGFALNGTYEPDGHLYWASLMKDGVEIMLNARREDDERPDKPDADRAPGHADVELYFQCDDVDHICAQFKANGLDAGPPTEQHGRREIVVSDPDGFRLSFHT